MYQFFLTFVRHGRIALFVIRSSAESSNPESMFFYDYFPPTLSISVRTYGVPFADTNLIFSQVYGADKLHEAIKNRPEGQSLITVWLLSDLVRRVSIFV